MSKLIPLTQGKYAIVDDEDFDELSKHKWCLMFTKGRSYAVRRPSENLTILMHRFILNPPKQMDTDHKNGDGLDNRRSNLRACKA